MNAAPVAQFLGKGISVDFDLFADSSFASPMKEDFDCLGEFCGIRRFDEFLDLVH